MSKFRKLSIAWILLLLFSLTLLNPIGQAAAVIAQPGDSNDTVAEINTMLKALGYYYGTVSSSYTTATKSAVTLFQRAKGLSATGIVDETTYSALKTAYVDRASSPTAPPPTSTPTTSPKLAPAPTTPSTPTYTSVKIAGLTADEQLMFDMVNQERIKAGVAPLKIDMRMVESARTKSQDMITNNYFSHTSPTLGGFASLIRNATGGDYAYVGENLAGNRTVEAAMKALMNSEGHRKNILNPKYTHMGIGIVNGGPYGKMFTQHFGG